MEGLALGAGGEAQVGTLTRDQIVGCLEAQIIPGAPPDADRTDVDDLGPPAPKGTEPWGRAPAKQLAEEPHAPRPRRTEPLEPTGGGDIGGVGQHAPGPEVRQGGGTQGRGEQSPQQERRRREAPFAAECPWAR